MKSSFIILLLLFTVYFTQAQIVNIPDANFKNALVNYSVVDSDGDGIGDMDADINDDGEIQVAEAEAVVFRLIIPEYQISSLIGIESFINLEVLSCHNNLLTTIDITNNLHLRGLWCSNNALTSLDVSQNPNLEWLRCYYNQLTSLDVTQNVNLLSLYCSDNSLSSIDVTQNSNLTWLYCSYNQISSLDVIQNPNLKFLNCWNNNLTSLDVTQNLQLEVLNCWNNQITELNMSQHQNLEELKCMNNQLTSLNIKNGNNHNMDIMLAYNNPNLNCITVDDETASYPICDLNNYSGWCKDNWTVYSENCTLNLTEFDSFIINIYPNPVHNMLNISSEYPIELIYIYSLQGQVIQVTSNNQIDVSLFSSGLYFASIVIDGKNIVKKFIKD